MNFDEIQRYPLCWPDSWPRAAYRISSRFEERTVNQAFEALGNELKRLGCSEWKLSTNIPRTSSGSINSTFRQPADPGVAAYFKYNKKPVALACDKWSRLEDNIYALAKLHHPDTGGDRESWERINRAYQMAEAMFNNGR
jgi:hypothetical protein